MPPGGSLMPRFLVEFESPEELSAVMSAGPSGMERPSVSIVNEMGSSLALVMVPNDDGGILVRHCQRTALEAQDASLTTVRAAPGEVIPIT
jgi:hypothetical protein